MGRRYGKPSTSWLAENNYNNRDIELKINTELVTDPTTIATELNTFFLDFVYEITQLFNSHSYSFCSINYAQPILIYNK